MQLPVLRLKKNEQRRVLAGHLWIYSNEVDVVATPLKGFTAGDQVVVEDSRGKTLATAYVNPASLISARIVNRRAGEMLDAPLIAKRLQQALALRETLFPDPYYRLVYSESDALPGLIVDRYGDTLVLQINTVGMQRLQGEIVHGLQALLSPVRILLRSDTQARAQEGLEESVGVLLGDESAPLTIIENGVRFEVPALAGQKTGWFYDHRLNRARMMTYAKGRRVLDVFSYVGGWGIQAAVAGASSVTCLDSSATALEQCHHNATLNGVADQLESQKGDAFELLKQLVDDKQKFDVVIVDPPAFIKRRKDMKQGEAAYQRINHLAMRLLSDGGTLMSASCSQHFSRDQLLRAINRAVGETKLSAQLIEQGHQGPDHPIHPAMSETEYLHAFFLRCLRS